MGSFSYMECLEMGYLQVWLYTMRDTQRFAFAFASDCTYIYVSICT